VAAEIALEGIGHRYASRGANGGVRVLEGVSARVEPGATAAIIGRSGCGKTTLLEIIAGLILPTAGAVHIGGRPVGGPSPKWNVMFQQPSLFPWMSVFENAALGLRLAGRRTGLEPAVARALERVGIAEYAEANVRKLSGGQQQRVALARSLALEPEVMLLDEPFSSLDAFTREALQAEVGALVHELGITTVIVTHDIDEALIMADRVLVISEIPGRITGEFAVGLPFPRHTDSPVFRALRGRVMAQFDDTAGRAAA
jgi:sulfonate transport system ATP-binding protein